MKDRLEKFIKMEGLTPSRFAEIMGVQPSSISHILGGRNKPSFDFLEKFLQRFPRVNPDWLILNKSPMYRTMENPATTPNNNPSYAPLLAPSGELPLYNQISASSEAGETPENTNNSSSITDSYTSEQQIKETAQKIVKSKTNGTYDAISAIVADEEIDRIVIFLRNNSFISYKPR